MALYAVFKELGLEVEVRPILKDIDKIYEIEENNIVPHIGDVPGRVVMTEWGGQEGDDPDEIPLQFGEKLRGVNWITDPLFKDLALVHLTVCLPASEGEENDQVVIQNSTETNQISAQLTPMPLWSLKYHPRTTLCASAALCLEADDCEAHSGLLDITIGISLTGTGKALVIIQTMASLYYCYYGAACKNLLNRGCLTKS